MSIITINSLTCAICAHTITPVLYANVLINRPYYSTEFQTIHHQQWRDKPTLPSCVQTNRNSRIATGRKAEKMFSVRQQSTTKHFKKHGQEYQLVVLGNNDNNDKDPVLEILPLRGLKTN